MKGKGKDINLQLDQNGNHQAESVTKDLRIMQMGIELNKRREEM